VFDRQYCTGHFFRELNREELLRGVEIILPGLVYDAHGAGLSSGSSGSSRETTS
jgi:hypothetical protein